MVRRTMRSNKEIDWQVQYMMSIAGPSSEYKLGDTPLTVTPSSYISTSPELPAVNLSEGTVPLYGHTPIRAYDGVSRILAKVKRDRFNKQLRDKLGCKDCYIRKVLRLEGAEMELELPTISAFLQLNLALTCAALNGAIEVHQKESISPTFEPMDSINPSCKDVTATFPIIKWDNSEDIASAKLFAEV